MNKEEYNKHRRELYRLRNSKSELTGQYCEKQSLLERRENIERRNKAIEAGDRFYKSTARCQHGSIYRHVKSDQRYCHDCYQEKYRKKQKAKGKIMQHELPVNPRKVALENNDKYYMSSKPCVNGNYYWRVTKRATCQCACCELQHHPRKHWHPYDYHVIVRNQHERVMRGFDEGIIYQRKRSVRYTPKNSMALINSVWGA